MPEKTYTGKNGGTYKIGATGQFLTTKGDRPLKPDEIKLLGLNTDGFAFRVDQKTGKYLTTKGNRGLKSDELKSFGLNDAGFAYRIDPKTRKFLTTKGDRGLKADELASFGLDKSGTTSPSGDDAASGGGGADDGAAAAPNPDKDRAKTSGEYVYTVKDGDFAGNQVLVRDGEFYTMKGDRKLKADEKKNFGLPDRGYFTQTEYSKTLGSGNIIPKELFDDPYYMQLDADSKAIIAYNWSILEGQDAERASAFADALVEATGQADIFFGEQLNIIKDQIGRDFQSVGFDLASQEADFTLRKDNIDKELASGTSFLTAEEQASLAVQSADYDQQILGLRENLAGRGLSSSTIRTRSEEQSAEQNKGVVESINRRTQKQIDDLKRTSAFNTATIDSASADAKRKAREDRTNFIRSAEESIGTDALKGLGFDEFLLGGITGSVAGDKASDILARVNALTALEGF